MTIRRLGTAALLIAMLGALPAAAQIVKRAQAGFRFLENPVSAEAVGRGGVGVALMTNSNAVYWNPAGIAWIPQTADISVNYTKGIAGINYFAPAVALKLWDFGVVAFSGTIMDYGEFHGTQRANNDVGFVETGSFSPKAVALGVAFSQKVSDRFSYGVNLKYAYQNLGSATVGISGNDLSDPNLQTGTVSYTKGEPAVDIGAYYDFQYHGIRFGAALQNISRELKYEVEKFPMPFSVNFGATIDPLSFFLDSKEHSFIFSVESRHPRDFQEKIKAGVEYRYQDFLTVRTGYMSNSDERGFTAGVGVAQDFRDLGMRVDYAYEAFGLFGGAHYITLGFAY